MRGSEQVSRLASERVGLFEKEFAHGAIAFHPQFCFVYLSVPMMGDSERERMYVPNQLTNTFRH
jgi:hypothetical protein